MDSINKTFFIVILVLCLNFNIVYAVTNNSIFDFVTDFSVSNLFSQNLNPNRDNLTNIRKRDFNYSNLTPNEIRMEIARLTKVAENIKNQLRLLGVDPDIVVDVDSGYVKNVCLKTNTIMNRGFIGDGVKELQRFLYAQGVYPYDKITGYYGSLTADSVEKWQRRNNIIGDGEGMTTKLGDVDVVTLHAMHKGCVGGMYVQDGGDARKKPPVKLTEEQLKAQKEKEAEEKEERERIKVEKYKLSLDKTTSIVPLVVNLKLIIKGSTCTSYEIDWGDDTKKISVNAQDEINCKKKDIVFSKRHTYPDGGIYKFVFKNGMAPLDKLKPINSIDMKVIDGKNVKK